MGEIGEKLMKKFKKTLSYFLPANLITRVVYKGKKVGSYFQIKDAVPFIHQSDLVYAFVQKSATEPVTEYVGETKVRLGTRIHEHCVTDKKSSIFKYKNSNNIKISQDDFIILEKGYNNYLDRKIAEALYVKKMKPRLNEQVESYKLLLFN